MELVDGSAEQKSRLMDSAYCLLPRFWKKMKTLEELQSNDFVPYLNQTFTVRLKGTDSIELELVLVTESRRGFRAGARQPFALHFLGPVSSQYLLQHMYRLEHPEMGVLDIFLVPLSLQAGRMRYEAIFG